MSSKEGGARHHLELPHPSPSPIGGLVSYATWPAPSCHQWAGGEVTTTSVTRRSLAPPPPLISASVLHPFPSTLLHNHLLAGKPEAGGAGAGPPLPSAVRPQTPVETPSNTSTSALVDQITSKLLTSSKQQRSFSAEGLHGNVHGGFWEWRSPQRQKNTSGRKPG